MPSAKDVTNNNAFWKVFVVGDAGTGKSQFASTFPTPAYLFDFDKGVKTYRGKDFDYDQFSSSPTGWLEFEKKLKEVALAVKEGKYKTVVLDSTTAMIDLAMERALQLDPKRSPTNGPVWNVHYGMVKNLVEGRIRQMAELPCNVVVIGHLEIIRNEETGGIVAVQPMLTGNLPTKIPMLFDEVYYAQTKTVESKTKWILQTVAKGFYKARSRTSGVMGLLDEYVPNDFGEIISQLTKREGAKK